MGKSFFYTGLIICGLGLAPSTFELEANIRADQKELLQKAYDIATHGISGNIARVKNKRTGETKSFVLAGAHQFHTLWARDFSMAVPGLMVMGESSAVKDSLEALMTYQ